jgi:hypothetical protein
MTNNTKIIIQEIGSMGLSELEAIQNEVARMINLKKMEALLEAFIGAGTGIWDQDAQDYVDGLREED